MSHSELAALLTEFAAAPGNFLVRLGEPKALHARIDTLAAWALGRTPEELSDRADQLREAAVLFVLRACFAADNTHYQVLGISPKTLTPESLRTRYRALIRLTHPDMGVQGLPANAAGIVNRANEVLGDPDLRSRYDDLLATRKRLNGGGLGGIVVAPQITLRTSWRERWQSLVARYPTAVWAVPGALGTVVLGMGLLIWASATSTDNRMLIVARADDPMSDREPSRDRPKGGKAEPGSGVPRSPSALSGTGSGGLDRSPKPPAAPPTALAGVDARTLRQAPPSAVSGSGNDAGPDRRVEPRQTPTGQGQDVVFRASAQEPPRATSALRADAEPAVAVPAPVQKVESTTPPAPAVVRAPTLAPPPVPVFSPPPTPTPPVTVAAAPPPAPKPAPVPAETWNVDSRQAKTYLADLIMSLERPARARRNNAYLAEMNVKGSLLQPALQLMRRFPDVSVEHMNWSDSLRPGAMNLQGMVTVRARNPDTGEARQVNFSLNAEFWGTRDGTVMATLSLKEDD